MSAIKTATIAININVKKIVFMNQNYRLLKRVFLVYFSFMSYMFYINALNQKSTEPNTPLYHGRHIVGLLKPEIVSCVKDFFIERYDGLSFPDQGPLACSDLMDRVADRLLERGYIAKKLDELFDVSVSPSNREPLFSVSRSLMSLFGFISYAIHVNGYTVDSNGQMKIWVATRAKDRLVYPGRKDQIVAGGQPSGISFQENLEKESYEEAGFCSDIVKAQAKCAHILSHHNQSQIKNERCVIAIYDLFLESNQIPHNIDGEVDSFDLMTPEQVLELLKDKTVFKPNCAVIMIDFLMRQNVLTPDNCPEFFDFQTKMIVSF